MVGGFLALPLAALADPIESQYWGDNHTLCTTCAVDHGNVVGTWQSFLWADGFHNKCGSSGIDGIFGSITKADTKDWQSNHLLTVDGIVGSATWQHAKAYHVIHDSGDDYHYDGLNHTPNLLTQGSSPVQWYWDTPTDGVNLQFFITGHPSIDYNTC